MMVVTHEMGFAFKTEVSSGITSSSACTPANWRIVIES